jgi:hypothetical protein
VPGALPPGVRAPYDGISVAALVCALTCCAAPVAVGLGFAGLVRTSGGRRRGLWAAVTGLVLGVIGCVLGVVVLVGGGIALLSTASESDAVPGDCLDVTRAFDGTDLWWSDCYGPHDAEVLAAGRLGSDAAMMATHMGDDAWCREAIGPDLADLVREKDLVLGLTTDSYDPDAPEEGDAWFCWAERSDHRKLEAPLVDRGPGHQVPEDA